MSINQFIEQQVKSSDVVLFMKGTPQFPQCGFSGQVVQILDYLGVPYKGVNVLDSDELRQGVKAYSNWPTIPQLYVKGEFLGGADRVVNTLAAHRLFDTACVVVDFGTSTNIDVVSRKGEFLGGCDIIREMFQAGELQGALKDKGVALREQAQA